MAFFAHGTRFSPLPWGRCKDCEGVYFVDNGVRSEFERADTFLPSTGNLTDFSTRCTRAPLPDVIVCPGTVSLSEWRENNCKVKQRPIWRPYEDDEEITAVDLQINTEEQRLLFKQCPFYDVVSNNAEADKPFGCDHVGCGKSFARNEELTRHKRIHSGEKPHQCEVCRKCFGRKDHLTKHRKTHLKASERRTYICRVDGCERRYTRSDALTRHQWTVHNIKWKQRRLS